MNRKYLKYGILILCFTMTLGVGYNMDLYIWRTKWIQIQDYICRTAEITHMPVFYCATQQRKQSPIHFIMTSAMKMQPVLSLMNFDHEMILNQEDEETAAMILFMENQEEEQKQSQDENRIKQRKQSQINSTLSVDKLKNFKYLIQHFYIVDSTTKATKKLLNYEQMAGKNLKIDSSSQGPKILIYHTHSQEAFADSRKGEISTTIVGVGEYLSDRLNKKGIPTIHDKGIYDVIQGKLDRSKAYEYAEKSVKKILKKNPSVEVVIDLHRDGVDNGTHLVKNIKGKKVAQIMFFNGLSFSKSSGPIDYLYNPYIEDNLAFSFQMQLACEKSYPGWSRKIYLRAYRYNLHLKPKDLLIEAGAQTNTLQEMKNAMDLLADTLYSVLTG